MQAGLSGQVAIQMRALGSSAHGEMEMNGDITNNYLWIERADGLPISEEEQIYISRRLGIRHPKLKDSN